MRVLAWIIGVTLLLFVIVYGSFALYEGSWSLQKHNLSHSLQLQQQNANGQASIVANGWNYQTTLGQEIVAGISAVQHDTTSIDAYKQSGNTTEVTDETGQRAYDAGQVCYYASQVNSALPRENPDTTWVNDNCSGGTLKVTSIYYVRN
jgi:hypothetical protein